MKYRRAIATGVLGLTLMFGSVACSPDDDKVDQTEDELEDKADEVEEDVRENTP